MVWLVSWATGLAITACNAGRPVPTAIATLTSRPPASSTPAPAPTRVPPTETPYGANSIIWRTTTLESHQSFDFRQGKIGAVTAGDLYYIAVGPRQGTACFWANNGQQVGGRDLGFWPLLAQPERPLPRDRYSGQCIYVIRGHVYVYGLSEDERLVVLRVVDTGPSWVTFDYILHK